MNLFWYIYVSGFITALLVITGEFRKWCMRHRISPEAVSRDYGVLLMILLDALGSWVSVGFFLFTKDKN